MVRTSTKEPQYNTVMEIKETLIEVSTQEQLEMILSFAAGEGISISVPFTMKQMRRHYNHTTKFLISMSDRSVSWSLASYYLNNPEYKNSKQLTFEQFSSQYIKKEMTDIFPFAIKTNSKHEQAAAAMFLISQGCLVHGHEDHLGGTFHNNFNGDMSLVVTGSGRFSGSCELPQTIVATFDFFNDHAEIAERLIAVIEKGDHVVATEACSEQFTVGQVYTVTGAGDDLVDIFSDDAGETNSAPASSFRKATKEEIAARFKLPRINSYEGKIDGGKVIYGCALIDLKILIRSFGSVPAGDTNRMIASIVLSSGVTITRTAAARIIDVWHELSANS